MGALTATDRLILRTIELRLLQREIRGWHEPAGESDGPRGRPVDAFRGLQILGADHGERVEPED